MGILSKIFKKKKDIDIEAVEKKEVALYILAETKKDGLIDYLAGCGIAVKYLTESIADMNKTLIMADEPYRLIVLDFSAGVFSGIDEKNSLIELIESASVGENSVTMFTNNGSIEKDILDKKLKSDISQYKGVSSITRKLRYYPEKYVDMGEFDNLANGITAEEPMQFKGVKVEKTKSARVSVIDLEATKNITELQEEGAIIEAFEVRL